MTIPRILSIAGSDSGGGAGIQADIKTITILGGHATTAVTAITAQNTCGVTQVMSVPPDLIVAQIEAVLSDIGTDAIKIGMVGSAVSARLIADRLHGLSNIVFDPVMIASSGAVLADEATIATFGRLMANAYLVTPNAPELALLTGRQVRNVDELECAGRVLAERHSVNVLAKGGHLAGDALSDVLIAADRTVRRWSSLRIESGSTHGTGCTLSSAIATGLAGGMDLADAITLGRDYVRAAIDAAAGLGRGHGPMGHALGRSHSA